MSKKQTIAKLDRKVREQELEIATLKSMHNIYQKKLSDIVARFTEAETALKAIDPNGDDRWLNTAMILMRYTVEMKIIAEGSFIISRGHDNN